MTFTTFCRLLSQAVIHSRQPVALNWARNSFGLVLTVFLRKICNLGIAEYFLIVLFQISEIQKDKIRFKKYTFFARYVFDCRGEGSSNRNASRGESVEAGDKSVEAGDESIEAGEKHRNHVIIVITCRRKWEMKLLIHSQTSSVQP